MEIGNILFLWIDSKMNLADTLTNILNGHKPWNLAVNIVF